MNFKHNQKTLCAFEKVVSAFENFLAEVKDSHPGMANEYSEIFEQSFEAYNIERCKDCERLVDSQTCIEGRCARCDDRLADDCYSYNKMVRDAYNSRRG